MEATTTTADEHAEIDEFSVGEGSVVSMGLDVGARAALEIGSIVACPGCGTGAFSFVGCEVGLNVIGAFEGLVVG